MASSTRFASGSRTAPGSRTTPGSRTASGSRSASGSRATPRPAAGGSRGSGRRTGTRGPGTGPPRPAKKRRNPNRWRFYVLLALLGLIAVTVAWFTAGREALDSYLDTRAGAEQSETEAEQTEPAGDDGPPQDAGTEPEGTGGEPAGAEEQDEPADGTDPAAERGDGALGPAAEPDEQALANPVQCRSEALRVRVDPGGRVHSPGQEVAVGVQVANAGVLPCLVDLGHESMQVEISSGSDQIWGTAQCPRGDGERRLLLDADAAVSHTVTWPGQRCSSGDVAAAGTYRIDVAVPATESPVRADAVIELD